jgi:radical SAM protein with 4Fe4S-binding SPASM domain
MIMSNRTDAPAELADTETPLPHFVQIEPVGQCNLRCRMCAIQFRQDGPPHGPPAFIDEAVFQRLIEQCSAADELQLQGLGEPMMHPRFFEMVEFATARGLRVSTNSNLTLLTPARARRCVTSGLSSIHVSIDGANAATYEFIRPGARFDKVLRNLRRLMEARVALCSPIPHVRIVTVLMRRNLEELVDIVALAAAHGVSEVFVQHLCHDFTEDTLPGHYAPMRAFIDTETLEHEDVSRVDAAFAAARAAAERAGVRLRLPRIGGGAVPNRNQLPCNWPWNGIYLSYKGDAMPCCMVSTPDRVQFGNMAEAGVETIWRNDSYQAFRAALKSDNPPAICHGCAVYRGKF